MYEKKNFAFTIVTAALLALLVGTNIYYSRKFDESGRLTDQLTERLSDATESNRRLKDTIGQCQYLVTELADTSSRSIRTVGEAINTIEEIRTEVQSLELELGLWDSDGYYSRTDDWLRSELGNGAFLASPPKSE